MLNKNNIYIYILILILVSIPLFLQMDKSPIRLWDESRLAINAIEMSQNNNFIVTHFYGEPDMWNTKPPLLIWIQTLFIKLLGIKVLAIRLPIAIAGLFTSVIILRFGYILTKRHWLGILSCFVLITIPGYIDYHVMRTGDYDGLMILFTTMYCLSFYLFCKNNDKKYLYIFFVSAALSVLTKSIAGLLFMPALVIFCIIEKQVLSTLKNKHFYIGILVFLIPIISYYLLREHNNPGYIHQVFENEVGGRYLQTLENNAHPWHFYFSQIINQDFSYWLYFLISSTVITLMYNHELRKITVFAWLCSLVYLVVITISQTKLQWYEAPVYPFFAIIIASGFITLINIIKRSDIRKPALTIVLITIGTIYIHPYLSIYKKIMNPYERPDDKHIYEISRFLNEEIKNNRDFQNFDYVTEAYEPHIVFYIKMAQNQNLDIDIITTQNLNSGQKVFTNDPKTISLLEDIYNTEILYNFNDIKFLRIVSKM